MNKGTLIQFLKGNTTHRFPKLVTLAVASSVLVTMVTIDASASTRTYVGTTAVASSFSTSVAAQTNAALTPFRYRRNAPTTTTTNPSSRTTSLSSSSTSGPTPTTTTTVASTTTTNGRTPTTTTTVPAVTTTTTTPAPTTTTTVAPAPNLAYPVGTVNSSEPSGYAPPSASALAGYGQTYVTDFTGSSLPSEWGTYEGQPGGDPGGQFDQAHVTVGGGMLHVLTSQDPAFNNEWVTGGACLCNIAGQTYGAYFVRSRMTGAGPTGVELLWPDANVWPPEIDFNETNGSASATTATVHYSSANSQVGRSLNIDMTQWHTWGVIWTPTSITYTVDGTVWGTVTTPASIPHAPMHISLQSQTWCSSGWACPTTPQSMQVDWVAQYQAN
jgi:hypothetical protein